MYNLRHTNIHTQRGEKQMYPPHDSIGSANVLVHDLSQSGQIDLGKLRLPCRLVQYLLDITTQEQVQYLRLQVVFPSQNERHGQINKMRSDE